MKTRRKARQFALQILYKADISENGAGENYSQEMESLHEGTDARRYCESIVSGVLERRLEIDGVIEDCSENWTIERMALVDRNILRIAVFELLYAPETPYKVVIDEAVELAKRYSSEESGAFINGILDRIHKEVPSRAVTAR